ncbi:flavodoxin domain-containing protein [Galbitalea soli]|uniref:Flavodoxin family protein n=1 Tax=Galbitalea soli TaxID=1268042 RepID=A0A7C9PLG1_9MICO|nr:flavodoxin family protein [Galbitalea soli]NYJ30774.1 hypothetical protein [Galbitalea soli]
MKALVVYESMFGNTRMIADDIAAGLRSGFETEVVRVGEAPSEVPEGTDLLVVGAPTHAMTMSLPRTRREAAREVEDPERGLQLEPLALGIGVREWIGALPPATGIYAAFDTRATAPRLLTGRAATRIAARLEQLGLIGCVRPESFRVTMENELLAGEAERAREWGVEVAGLAGARLRSGSRAR